MSVTIRQNISLKPFNTLALSSHAAFYCEIHGNEDIQEAQEFAEKKQLPFLVLGEGSNIVLAGDFSGLVLHIKSQGISFSRKDDEIIVDVAAGENWHSFVKYSLSQQWYGLENLALIPGTVGAAPIQNIGAYGLEVAQKIVSVTGWSIDQKTWITLSNTECEFSYRDSVFKHRLKDRFIVSSVRFSLSLTARPILQYPALRERFDHIDSVNPVDIASTVESIRKEKLPDPALLPNAGSFFKNPLVSADYYQELKKTYPLIPGYIQADGVKIPAAWLIDQAGWKGYRNPYVGIHDKQALVLINHDNATGQDVLDLASQIREDIHKRYGIELEIEPRVYC
jgi:UDP-N-acetylmuramate dehydrogenase